RIRFVQAACCQAERRNGGDNGEQRSESHEAPLLMNARMTRRGNRAGWSLRADSGDVKGSLRFAVKSRGTPARNIGVSLTPRCRLRYRAATTRSGHVTSSVPTCTFPSSIPLNAII